MHGGIDAACDSSACDPTDPGMRFGNSLLFASVLDTHPAGNVFRFRSHGLVRTQDAIGLNPTVVAHGLRQFLDLPNVEIDRPNQGAQALHWYEEGMNVADAIHVAWSEDADRLATFDQSFARNADGRSPCAVVSISTD